MLEDVDEPERAAFCPLLVRAEPIRADATFCRFCQHDVPRGERLDESASTAFLIENLRSLDDRTREKAIILLGDRGPSESEAIPLLRGMVEDPNRRIRIRAEWALERIDLQTPNGLELARPADDAPDAFLGVWQSRRLAVSVFGSLGVWQSRCSAVSIFALSERRRRSRVRRCRRTASRCRQHDPIPPESLRDIERLIGPGAERARDVRLGDPLGRDADADRDRRPRDAERVRANRVHELLGDHPRRRESASGRSITNSSPPTRPTTSPARDASSSSIAQLAQHHVADEYPAESLIALEVIDVDGE